MSLYGKSQEECAAIIENFRERFRAETGDDINPMELKANLDGLYHEKLRDLFLNTFGDLNPISVANCLRALEKTEKESEQANISANRSSQKRPKASR